MKCANCGRDNPAGARYCIHCGAEHSVPTPIAAAAAIASRARRGIPQAANAAHADPIPDEQLEPVETPPMVPETVARSSGHATIVPHPSSAASASTSRDSTKLPAYASGPRRSGIALSLVGACFFIAVGGFFAWRMFAPQVGMRVPGESVVTSSKPPVDGNPAPSSAASAAAPSRNSTPEETTGTARNDTAQSISSPGTSSAGTSSQVTDTAVASMQADASSESASSAGTSVEADAQVDAKSSSSAPVEITPLPAKPAPKAPRKTAAAQTPPQAAVAASAVPAAPPAATTAQPSTPAVVVAAAPKASKSTDQWAKLREELDSCTREDFIARVVCGQRVRFKYCSGSWGKVPECPGSPQGERGQ